MAHTRLSIECTLAAGETSVGYAHLRLFPAGAGAICWSSLWNKKQTKIKSKQDHYAGMERKRRLRGAVGVAARTPQRLTLSGATALTSTVSEHEYLLKKKAQMAICCLLAFHSIHSRPGQFAEETGWRKGHAPPPHSFGQRCGPQDWKDPCRCTSTRTKGRMASRVDRRRIATARRHTLSRAPVLWSGSEDAADDLESQLSLQSYWLAVDGDQRGTEKFDRKMLMRLFCCAKMHKKGRINRYHRTEVK